VRLSPPMSIRGPAAKPVERPPEWSAREMSAASAPDAKPLAGLRVLDFGQHLAGPFGAMVMADLGADVIKIESSAGDPMRPYEWAFIGCQRGKRALACNLKEPASQRAIRALARDADVVVHNLRLPAAERLGLSYETLGAENPRLIYTHCSAYGSKGPRRDWPGYDQLFQALSGWEDATSGEGNPPTWLRFGMMDHQCAFAATFGTLLALIERETTGRGQPVATSILGASILTTAGSVLVRGDGSVTDAPRLDALQLGVSPGRRLYACADGWIAVVANDAALVRLGDGLEARLAAQRVADAVDHIERAGGVAVRALTDAGPDFLADPENVALGLSTSYPHPTYGVLTQPGAFLSMSGAPMVSDKAPTTLGQHGSAILAEAGLDPAAVKQMVDGGLVVQVA
jgi:crotonobetainyl-CoA:carnitine CoA-transferase CaiB-like acyl-CoA transferase